jgi:hypothetical protein
MSEFSQLRRPKRGETEDDLLEQMKKFESSKASVSSQNIRKISKNDEKTKTSKFSQERQLKRQHQNEVQAEASPICSQKSV